MCAGIDSVSFLFVFFELFELCDRASASGRFTFSKHKIPMSLVQVESGYTWRREEKRKKNTKNKQYLRWAIFMLLILLFYCRRKCENATKILAHTHINSKVHIVVHVCAFVLHELKQPKHSRCRFAVVIVRLYHFQINPFLPNKTINNNSSSNNSHNIGDDVNVNIFAPFSFCFSLLMIAHWWCFLFRLNFCTIVELSQLKTELSQLF